MREIRTESFGFPSSFQLPFLVTQCRLVLGRERRRIGDDHRRRCGGGE
jgi:hypothetical protein